MIVNEFKSFYFISKIKEHKDNKDKILKLIEKIPRTDLDEKSAAHVTHSDWFIERDYPREYLDFFYKMVTPYMNEMMKVLKCRSWRINNGWFQQYSKNDFHSWHIHSGVNYSSVYYLELPSKEEKTQIYNVLDDKIIDISVTEGDLITFPAYLIHRSKPLVDDRKTVIAFNSDFDDPNLEIT